MSAKTDGDRILSAEPRADEHDLENTVRPQRMSEYLGQRQVKERIQISVAAAAKRGEAMDHTLLYGPPGLGKTTLAQVIARELAVGMRHTSGPVLERPGDLAALLTNLKARDVLFIDEVHRLNPVVQELLYPAMEDFRLDIVIGEGPAAHTMRLKLKPFTLVGATTRAGLLSSPLRDRFGIQERLELYSKEELQRIVLRAAGIMGISCTPKGAAEIAGARAGHAAGGQPAAAAGPGLRRSARRGQRGRRHRGGRDAALQGAREWPGPHGPAPAGRADRAFQRRSRGR